MSPLRGPRILFLVAAAVFLLEPVATAAQPTALGSSGDTLIAASSGRGAEFVRGHLIVKFRGDVRKAIAAGLKAAHGLQTIHSIGGSGAELVQVRPGEELTSLVQLGQRPEVEYVELNYVVYTTGASNAPVVAPGTPVVPGDPLYRPPAPTPSQWDMDRIDMPTAWGYTVGAPNVLVAVLDTGIDLTHPDLAGQWTYAGATPDRLVLLSAPDPSCGPNPTTPDDDAWKTGGFSHGTHVAGTIAAASTLAGGPALGIAGEAPGAKVLPIKVLDCTGSGSFSDVADAITFAARHGAKVINMSFGGYTFNDHCPGPLADAINSAFAAGLTMVAAAGNDGAQPNLNPHPQFPAGCAHVLAIGATGPDDLVTWYSQHNSTVDLAAPGGAKLGVGASDILSSLRVNAIPTETWATNAGTSMAAPHVSGCAALAYSFPNAVPAPTQVEGLLETSAFHPPTPTPTAAPTRTGTPTPSPSPTATLAPSATPTGTLTPTPTPGKDVYYGFGRIDCGAAIATAAVVAPSWPTMTPSPTATFTTSPMAIASPSADAAATATATAPSPTSTVTATPTHTLTPTHTMTPTHTPTHASGQPQPTGALQPTESRTIPIPTPGTLAASPTEKAPANSPAADPSTRADPASGQAAADLTEGAAFPDATGPEAAEPAASAESNQASQGDTAPDGSAGGGHDTSPVLTLPPEDSASDDEAGDPGDVAPVQAL